MNEQGKKACHDEAPVAFVPKRWEQVVSKDEKVDKHAWEFALLHEARTALRAGDLTVEGSQRYAAWEVKYRVTLSQDLSSRRLLGRAENWRT